MPPFKLTPSQHDKVMNDPVHYRLGNKRYIEKENVFECEASAADLLLIKKLVDEKVEIAAEKSEPVVGKHEKADNEESQGAGFVER